MEWDKVSLHVLESAGSIPLTDHRYILPRKVPLLVRAMPMRWKLKKKKASSKEVKIKLHIQFRQFGAYKLDSGGAINKKKILNSLCPIRES